MLLNIGINYLCLRFVFTSATMIVGSLSVASSVAAWVIAFCVSFPIGFTLSRYIVFPESNLHGRIQIFRYAMATLTFIILTYVLIKVFDIILENNTFLPGASYALVHTITYTIINVIVAVLSYISQRKFTFKSVEEPVEV